ncbi:protein of unknown function [Streptococcus thermophilus]|uniref:Uncharacterized protein n=1 Tax=Streptococcus thermophilus TaxID=1308 RepID=A0A8D6XU33_STRTR|nr:protein of unknown function [Streptococcus thermophilus]
MHFVNRIIRFGTIRNNTALKQRSVVYV